MTAKDPLPWSGTSMAHSFMLRLKTLGGAKATILVVKQLTVDGRTANDLPAGTMTRKAFLSFLCRVTGVFFCILLNAGVLLSGAF